MMGLDESHFDEAERGLLEAFPGTNQGRPPEGHQV